MLTLIKINNFKNKQIQLKKKIDLKNIKLK